MLSRKLSKFATTLVLVFASPIAMADGWSVRDGWLACISEDAFGKIASAAAAGDKQTGAVLIATGQCLITRGMTVVSSVDVGVFSGRSTFVYAGVKYWTYTEAISSH